MDIDATYDGDPKIYLKVQMHWYRYRSDTTLISNFSNTPTTDTTGGKYDVVTLSHVGNAEEVSPTALAVSA